MRRKSEMLSGSVLGYEAWWLKTKNKEVCNLTEVNNVKSQNKITDSPQFIKGWHGYGLKLKSNPEKISEVNGI